MVIHCIETQIINGKAILMVVIYESTGYWEIYGSEIDVTCHLQSMVIKYTRFYIANLLPIGYPYIAKNSTLSENIF